MISACTVMFNRHEPLTEILIESIAKTCVDVREILMVHLDAEKEGEKTKKVGLLKVRKIGYPISKLYSELDQQGYVAKLYGHAIGMHAAIEKANEDYILFTEPDSFYYPKAIDCYTHNFTKYDLNIIGVSHYWAHALCFSYFPTIMSALVEKSKLPSKDWLKGKLNARMGAIGTHLPHNGDWGSNYPMDGYYLLQGPIPEEYKKFPNTIDPNPIFDVGCNLWLWNEEKKGRWMSFQTLDVHKYTSAIYKTNFRLRERFKKQNLFYHLTGGTNTNDPEIAFKQFSKAYEESKND